MTDLPTGQTRRMTEPTVSAAFWIVSITALCIGGSALYACAAPFAAIAALAAIKMDRRSGLALVVTSWLANQALGFGLLGYPHTASTFAWGAAIGIGTVAGFAAAKSITEAGQSAAVTLVLAFAAAFVTYQTVLYAASFALGGTDHAFSTEIVWYVLKINALAFGGFVLLYRLAAALTRLRTAPPPVSAAT